MLPRITAVAFVLLIASCSNQSTIGPVYKAGTPCNAGSFTVIDGFSGARRGDCSRISHDHVELSIRPEDDKVTNPSPWYAFRLVPTTPTEATITLRYASDYHRYVPKISSDGRHWAPLDSTAVTTSADGMTATIRLSLSDEPLWVSAQELLTPPLYELWVKDITSNSHAEAHVLGLSGNGLPIDVLTTNADSREVLLLTGRQHPPEVSGAIGFFAFYESLMADTDLARQFRQRYQIIAIPLLNPDGVVGGNWRNNLGETDLNRDWGPFRQPETRLVADLLDRLDAEDRKIRVFLDFHSTAPNVFYAQDDNNVTVPPHFAQTWLDNARPRIPPSYVFTYELNPTDTIGIAKNYMYHRYGIPASTYEVGDETDRDVARLAAGIFAEELMKLMLEQSYE